MLAGLAVITNYLSLPGEAVKQISAAWRQSQFQAFHFIWK